MNKKKISGDCFSKEHDKCGFEFVCICVCHKTNIVNIKDCPKDWKKDSNYVFIGRGSFFGNPFRINKNQNRDEVIKKFEKSFTYILNKSSEYKEALSKLKRKNLVCFCKPLPCHGDILVREIEKL